MHIPADKINQVRYWEPHTDSNTNRVREYWESQVNNPETGNSALTM